jgi:hypothetical protein
MKSNAGARRRGALRCVSSPMTPAAASALAVSIAAMRPRAIVLETHRA